MEHTETYYAPDLAQVHDEFFGDIAAAAAATILKVVKQALPGPATILDLGCGSGTTAAILAKAGHQVTGIDYSAAMVDLARRNAPQATFTQASLFEFEFPQVDVITAISEAFNYLFDDRSSLDMLRDLFQQIHAALPTNGRFIFDILTTDVADYHRPRKAIIENDKWSMFLHVHVDTAVDQLTREITLFTKEGDRFRRSKEVHRQQLYVLTDIERLLKEVGFSAKLSRSYGTLDLRQGLVSFTCHKAR